MVAIRRAENDGAMQIFVMCVKIAALLVALTVLGGTVSVLLRGLLARWVPEIRRSVYGGAARGGRPPKAGRVRRIRKSIGLGVALIPVAGAFLIADQAINGRLLGAPTMTQTIAWIVATLAAAVWFTAVAPRRAGYVAAVAAIGLGVYLLLYVPAVLPAEVSKVTAVSRAAVPSPGFWSYVLQEPAAGAVVTYRLAASKAGSVWMIRPALSWSAVMIPVAAKATAATAASAKAAALSSAAPVSFSWAPLQELLIMSLACLAGGISLASRTIVADARAYRSRLNARVEQLTLTRAAVIDAVAAEFRRLERDLHDGAQARLVALGINLRTAEKLIKTSPDDAAGLVAECREASAKALTELRDLVRGVYPPVLADRGLADAIESLALDCPVRAVTDISLDGRPSAPVESAVYFAVAEALNNAAKHAQARTILIRLSHDATDEDDAGGRSGMLRAEVHDDGIGGADPASGTGLAGLERRLATFDGILAVSSPVGGPTTVVIEVPCELSSPKTFTC